MESDFYFLSKYICLLVCGEKGETETDTDTDTETERQRERLFDVTTEFCVCLRTLTALHSATKIPNSRLAQALIIAHTMILLFIRVTVKIIIIIEFGVYKSNILNYTCKGTCNKLLYLNKSRNQVLLNVFIRSK